MSEPNMLSEKELRLKIARERSWYESHENLHTLIFYMVHEVCVPMETVFQILYEPWDWHDEWEKADDLAAQGAGCFKRSDYMA